MSEQGTISYVMHFPRCLSPAEVHALHDFRVLFAEVRAIAYTAGAEAMREAAALALKAAQDAVPAPRSYEMAHYCMGLEAAETAIRALPLPVEPTSQAKDDARTTPPPQQQPEPTSC